MEKVHSHFMMRGRTLFCICCIALESTQEGPCDRCRAAGQAHSKAACGSDERHQERRSGAQAQAPTIGAWAGWQEVAAAYSNAGAGRYRLRSGCAEASARQPPRSNAVSGVGMKLSTEQLIVLPVFVYVK